MLVCQLRIDITQIIQEHLRTDFFRMRHFLMEFFANLFIKKKSVHKSCIRKKWIRNFFSAKIPSTNVNSQKIIFFITKFIGVVAL